MKFTVKNRQYEVDKNGVVVQLDHRPFVYDKNYSATYDKPEYRSGNDQLQAMRLGFAIGAHGRKINSLMDAGYGNGAFMSFAKQHVQYVYGIDVTGVIVRDCYIMPELVKADVLTMWDVLEHIADISFLKDAPYETICLSLPYCHFHTEGKEWLEMEYKHLKPDEHLRHFNEFSLVATMDSFGWKAVSVSGHEDVIRKSAHGLQNILSAAFKRL